MREFWLTVGPDNWDDSVFSLTTKNCFLHDVTNLGYQYSEGARKIGNRYVLVSREKQADSITGTLAFLGYDSGGYRSPYDQFFEFCEYTRMHPELYLHYATFHENDYQFYPHMFERRVLVTKIEKGEINKYGYLDCAITFTCLEPWSYRVVGKWPENVPIGGSGFKWPVKWPTDWPTAENPGIVWNDGGDPFTITIRSGENEILHPMDSPCELRIYGPITSPSWEHYVNGRLITTGSVNATVAAGQWLSISSLALPYDLSIYQNDSTGAITKVADVYQNANFYEDRFIAMKSGENIIKVRGTDTNDNTKMELDVRWYYDAV